MKKVEQLIAALNADNPEVVLESIKLLRQEGDISIITPLINLFSKNKNEEINNFIFSFLCDLKEKEAAQILVEAIDNKEYNNIETKLISTCWQSGIDYSEHFGFFADKVLYGKFETAIEAFSVIESFENISTLKDKDEVLHKLKNEITSAKKEQQTFILELIHFIEQS